MIGWPFGLYTAGMHNYIIDEYEFGQRTAMMLDSENNCGWNAVNDLQYEEHIKQEQKGNS